MKSHILFKPYLFTTSVVGIAIAVWQLATVPMNMSIHLMMLMIFNTVSETYEHYYLERHTALSLGAANIFFMMMFFTFSAVTLTCILAVLALSYVRMKKGLTKRIINEKTIFNMATYVIFNYVTYLGIKYFKIYIPSDTLILGVLVLFQNVLNGVMLCTIQSLALNKSTFNTLFKDKLIYYLYTLLLSLMLIYNYYYIGIWAVVGVYSIFMAVQKSTQLEVDNRIKGEKILLDNLTGVYNREFFMKTIEAKLRHKKQFSIIFMDMDEFKRINDEFGHLVGDKALQEFIMNIKGMIRKEDLVYRYGGDEFAVILSDNNAAEAVGRKLYAKKIEIHHKEETIDIKFSTGIYNCTGLEISYEVILGKVDEAMYKAKQKGGNQIVYVDSDKHDAD